MKIGITERGDAAYNLKWIQWVKDKKPAILITKNPERLYEILKSFLNPNIIVHCTITGNGGTILEKNVPIADKSILALQKFVSFIGKDRVVLRIDPIIPEEPYLQNSLNVLKHAEILMGENLPRVRISFFDNYEHVKNRMKETGMKFFDYEFHAPLQKRIEIWEKMGKPAICGEPKMPSTGCISDIDCKILKVEPLVSDHRQRNACECLSNKFELLDTPEQCQHNCVYCFWQKGFKNSSSALF